MKKVIGILLLFLSLSAFSQEAILIKKIKLNGKEELKKVRITSKTEYTYSGKPKICSYSGKVTDFYSYDKDGRTEKHWYCNANDKNGLFWQEFNINNNLFELKKADSYHEITYFYDENNRLLRTEDSKGQDSSNYTYDNNGNLILQETYWGKTEYEYDDQNRLIHEIIFQKLLKPQNGKEYERHEESFYEYDENNLLVYEKKLRGGYIYEYFTTYNAENHSEQCQKVAHYKDKLIYDLTDTDFYNEFGEVIHSIHYSPHYNSTGLLETHVTETFYEYDMDSKTLHVREIIDGEDERNLYYEWTNFDNGNLNTETCYEEVEDK